MLRSYIKDDQRKWDIHFAKFACAIRTARHEVTGFTSYHQNFGRDFKASGTLFGKTKTTLNIEAGPRQPVALNTKFGQVEQKLNQAYQRNKHQYDFRCRPMEFSPGDLVWRTNYVLSDAPSSS